MVRGRRHQRRGRSPASRRWASPKEDLVKFKDVHHKDLRPGGWDPVERLKDQDIDGVSAEVLYATYAMNLYHMPDAELQEASFNAYNEWLVRDVQPGARTGSWDSR